MGMIRQGFTDFQCTFCSTHNSRIKSEVSAFILLYFSKTLKYSYQSMRVQFLYRMKISKCSLGRKKAFRKLSYLSRHFIRTTHRLLNKLWYQLSTRFISRLRE